MTNQRIKEEHESYGMISINRTRGGHRHLFGASVEHNEKIEITISRGEVGRNLSNDWYRAKGLPLVSVALSPSQFAEAITSLNIGEGVPCTLLTVGKERMEDCPFTDKRTQFENEMKEHVEKMQRQLDNLTAETQDILRNKKSIGKGDRETILNSLSNLKMQLVSNVPFVLEQFNEQMYKSVTEAKMEVDAYTTSKIQALGLDKINELQKLAANTHPLTLDENK